MVLVTSYICKGNGSIEEMGQSKLGVAYDGTCTNVMHPHIRGFVVSVPEFRNCTAETEEKQKTSIKKLFGSQKVEWPWPPQPPPLPAALICTYILIQMF